MLFEGCHRYFSSDYNSNKEANLAISCFIIMSRILGFEKKTGFFNNSTGSPYGVGTMLA